jgi:hypothetical protein
VSWVFEEDVLRKNSLVMAGLVPAIHVWIAREVVDARVKPGHDDGG